MHTLFTVSLLAGWLLLSGPSIAQAQVAARSQPIILNESSCCTSPARIPVTVPTSEYRGMSYLTPSMAESMPTVVYAPVVSSTKPVAPVELPYAESTLIGPPAPIVEYRFYAPVSDYASVRSAPGTTPSSVVPQDYVVGRNVIGDPKLFRPGQQVRNFFRSLSL